MKWAQSADRKISANGSRVYITKDITNRVVHKWRSEEAAIMVGTNTALIDDPSLTNRLWSGKNPVRILLDMDLRLPTTLKFFDGSVKTIVFNSLKHDESGELEYYKISKGGTLVSEICNALYQRNIQSVLIEGGSRLAQTFIDAGAWDEARVITNEDLFITNGTAAPVFKTNTIINTEKILSDTIQYSRP